MANIDKVVKGLEEISDYFVSVYHHAKDREEINKAKDRCDVVEDAIALLKEQEDTRLIPRKPYHTKVEYANGSSWITDQCPECVERGVGIWDTLVDRYVKYCRRCGQALDWSEYNDRDKIDWDEYMSHVGERANRISKRR